MAEVQIGEMVIEVSKKAADDLQPLLDELAALRLRVVELEIQRSEAKDRLQAMTQEVEDARAAAVQWQDAAQRAAEAAKNAQEEAEARGASPQMEAPKSLRIKASKAGLERLEVSEEDLVQVAAMLEATSAFAESRKVRVRMRMGEAWIEHDRLPGGRHENVLAVCHPARIFAEG